MPLKEKQVDIELIDVVTSLDDVCPTQIVQIDDVLKESGEGEEEDLLYPCAAITYIEAVEGRRAKKQEWGLADIARTLTLWLILVSFFGLALNGRNANEASVFWLFLLFITSTWVTLAGWPLFASSLKGNGAVIDFGLTIQCNNFAAGFAYALLFLVSLMVLIFFKELMQWRVDIVPYPYYHYLSNNDVSVFLLFFWPTLDVIAKQIFCNGLVFTAVAKALHRIDCPLHELLAILASALAFACVHMDRRGFIIWFTGGVVSAIARYHTASLTPSVVAHVLVYFILFILWLYLMRLFSGMFLPK